MNETFPEQSYREIDIRVYYEDTDAGGIVYHANYLKFAERGRTESLREGGYDHREVREEFGLILVVRNIDISYLAPARLDDLLKVRTSIDKIGNSSITMKQLIMKQEKVLTELSVVVVAINIEGRPVRFPPQLRQIFGG